MRGGSYVLGLWDYVFFGLTALAVGCSLLGLYGMGEAFAVSGIFFLVMAIYAFHRALTVSK